MSEFASLFARAKTGDTDAADALMRRHLDGLNAFVRLKSGPLLRQLESCSDLVQTACREALRDLPKVDCADENAFKQWLFTVAHNKLRGKVDYHTARKRDPRLAVPLDAQSSAGLLGAYASFCTPSQHAQAREEVERVERAFATLDEEQRRAILEISLLGRSHADVAAELGKSEVAMRKVLSRARARLAVLLAGG